VRVFENRLLGRIRGRQDEEDYVMRSFITCPSKLITLGYQAEDENRGRMQSTNGEEINIGLQHFIAKMYRNR
jgi:hypothetical protein